MRSITLTIYSGPADGAAIATDVWPYLIGPPLYAHARDLLARAAGIRAPITWTYPPGGARSCPAGAHCRIGLDAATGRPLVQLIAGPVVVDANDLAGDVDITDTLTPPAGDV